MSEKRAHFLMVAVMILFGSIGLVRRAIPASSATVAFIRGGVGAVFLLILRLLRREKPVFPKDRSTRVKLLLSALALAGNWILLFEAYRYTTISVATVCYYLAPIFALLLSRRLLGEKTSLKITCCGFAALLGVIFTSGVLENGFSGIRGVVMALLAAVMYMSIILLNKSIRGVAANDRTFFQLAVSAVLLLPYTLLRGEFSGISWELSSVVLLLFVSVVQTGMAYSLYFFALQHLPIQHAALLSYLDPLVAILISTLILREPITLLGVLGLVLILGAAVVGEIQLPKLKRRQ